MSTSENAVSRSRSPAQKSNPSSRSPSKRRPLHERTPSQANELASPTIRIVEDEDSLIYSKSPFPSSPSQILSPRNAPGYAFERKGSRVSDQGPTTNAIPQQGHSEALVPRPLSTKKSNRASTSSNTSDAETIPNYSPFTPSSSRFSQGTSPPSTPNPSTQEDTLGSLDEVAEDLSSQDISRSTIRAVTPSSAGTFPKLKQPISEASLNSSSSDTVVIYRDDNSSTPSIVTPPPRNPNRPPSAGRNSQKQASNLRRIKGKTNLTKAPSNASTDSFDPSLYSAISDDRPYSSDRPRSASSPITPSFAQYRTIEGGVSLQYPIVRAPSASSSWAESRVLPKHPSRMNEGNGGQPHLWSGRLSTIPSESEPSGSYGRPSQSISNVSTTSPNAPRRRQTIASIASSTGADPPTSSESSVPVPRPLFTSQQPPPRTGDSEEQDDTLAELQSPPLRQQRSGFFSIYSRESRPESASSNHSTGFFSTIPLWARVYYRRGERNSIGAPDSSTTDLSESARLGTAQSSGPSGSPTSSTFPEGIYHPRKRPHDGSGQQRQIHQVRSNDSLAISEAEQELTPEHELYAIRPPRVNMSATSIPRLRQDRRSAHRLSAWKPPSLDQPLGNLRVLFGRQHRQVLFFCIGFVFPLAWVVAAFLPLPHKPGLSKEGVTPSQLDIEQAIQRNVGPMEERQYLKAKWWRNLNRAMSVVGLVLIGVIIALAIVASRM